MKNNFVPYIGPRFFEKKDKELFFGRDYETRELCSRIIAHSVVLCYSQSGAGKTSLINAGVIPHLEKEGFNVLPVARVSGQIPHQLDPNEIKNIYMFNALFNWSGANTPVASLASFSMKNFLDAEKKISETDAPLLIIFDQFEELITHYQERWTEREHFFKQVVETLEVNPMLRVVFVMREDYIAYLDPYITLFQNKLNVRFRLERMKKEAAKSAILGPIKKTNIDYAEGVADLLINELLKVKVSTATGETITIPGEYIEPVQLQVVCQNLWNNLPEGVNTITTEYINTFGSVDDALRKFYDEAVSSVSASNQIKEQDLRHWFEKHLITLAGTRGTVFRGPKQTGEILNIIIEELQSKHIIRAEYRAGGLWYELTHDSLIKAVKDSNKLYNQALSTRAEQYYLEGIQNLDKHLYKEAITAFESAINSDPNYMLAHAYLADIFNKTEDYTKALEAVNKTLEIDPKYVWAYNQRGIIHKNIKENEKALEDLNRAIELDREYKWAYANKSDVLKEMLQYNEALAAVNKALEIDPGYVWGYNQRGIIYKELKNNKKALEDLDRAVELDKDYKWAYANKSDVLKEMAQYTEALAAVNKALEIDPGYVWGYNQRGIIYKELKEYSKALVDLNRAIELDKNYKWAFGNKSDVLKEMGQYTEALAEVNRALEIDPAYVWGYHQRGIIYKELKEYEKALIDLDRAIELDKSYKWAYANKADLLNVKGDNTKALEAINKAIEIDPEYAWAYGLRGKIYNDTAEYEKALVDCDKAIELGNIESWILGNKSYAHNQLGEYENALEAINKALESDSKYAWAYGMRGKIYIGIEKYKEALIDVNKAIELGNGEKWIYDNKSYAHNLLGEYENALQSINKALDLNPNDGWSFNQRGIIYKNLNEFEKAIQDFEEALRLEQDYYEAYGNRGETLLNLNKKTEAAKDFIKVIEICTKQLYDDNVKDKPYFTIAWYSYLLGEYKQAIEAGEKGTAINPNFPVAYFNLGMAYLAAEDDDKAVKAFEVGIKSAKGSSTFEINRIFEDSKNDIKDLMLTKPVVRKTAENIITLLENAKKKILDSVKE